MKKIPDIRTLLKAHFFAGLLVVIPLGVIAWILAAVLRALWRLQELVPEGYRPEAFVTDPQLVALLRFAIVIAATALVLIGISFLGWISKQYLGKKTLKLVAEAIEHIPVIRSVYSALDQLLRTLAAGGGQQFSRVVYVEYPRKGMWTLAFVTGPSKHLPHAAGERFLNLYVPTTPNPTSGFFLIASENEVRESHLKVEDAFKTILSLGIAEPDQNEDLGAP